MRILLDTSSLNSLKGCPKNELNKLTKKMREKNVRLCTLFNSMEERNAREDGVKDYQSMLRNMTEFAYQDLELTISRSELNIPDITTKGLGKETTPFEIKLFKELKNIIKECENNKGNKKTCKNLKIDSIIGVSSLKYDIFITSDDCLKRSLDKLIKKYENEIPSPETYLVRSDKNDVLDEIYRHLQ